ncbi:hypothetical protein Btru_032835 [Bulinus truncatus]|nr:hypothetical protein Btru_032835 [Bulinus truncatus]
MQMNMSLGEEKTGLTLALHGNNSVEIEVSGNDSKTDNSIIANMVSYIIWQPEKWNFGQKGTHIMKANSTEDIWNSIVKGRQLDEMETIFHVPEVTL